MSLATAANPLQNAHLESDQERSANSQPRHAAQLPSTHQEYPKSVTTLPQAPEVVQGSLKETHPSVDVPCNANTDLNQEQHCDEFSYNITASAQLQTMEDRSTNEVQPSSSMHNKKRKKKGKRNPSTPIPLEESDHQEIPYQGHMNASNSKAAMFQNAQGFNISGDPHFVNNVTVNQHSNLGGSQGVEDFKQSISFEAFHDSAVHGSDRYVDQGIREKTLKQVQDWMGNPNATEQIAWLHGPASIGKTAIALEIAQQKNVVATFFFNRSDASRTDGNRLFPTLAWQLAISMADIKDHIIHSINKYSDLAKKRVEVQFEYLISQPFVAMKKATSTQRPSGLVIIDGVDECGDIGLRQRILKVIGNAILDPRVPLRFIICSRPDAQIQTVFDLLQCPVLSIDLVEFHPVEEIRKREEKVRTREEELKEEERKLMEEERKLMEEERKLKEEKRKLMEEERKLMEEERKLKEGERKLRVEECKLRVEERKLKEEEHKLKEEGCKLKDRVEEIDKKEEEIKRREEALNFAEEIRQKAEEKKRLEEELMKREELKQRDLEQQKSESQTLRLLLLLLTIPFLLLLLPFLPHILTFLLRLLSSLLRYLLLLFYVLRYLSSVHSSTSHYFSSVLSSTSYHLSSFLSSTSCLLSSLLSLLHSIPFHLSNLLSILFGFISSLIFRFFDLLLSFLLSSLLSFLSFLLSVLSAFISSLDRWIFDLLLLFIIITILAATAAYRNACIPMGRSANEKRSEMATTT